MKRVRISPLAVFNIDPSLAWAIVWGDIDYEYRCTSALVAWLDTPIDLRATPEVILETTAGIPDTDYFHKWYREHAENLRFLIEEFETREYQCEIADRTRWGYEPCPARTAPGCNRCSKHGGPLRGPAMQALAKKNRRAKEYRKREQIKDRFASMMGFE